jgi:hypothetical protein
MFPGPTDNIAHVERRGGQSRVCGPKRRRRNHTHRPRPHHSDDKESWRTCAKLTVTRNNKEGGQTRAVGSQLPTSTLCVAA